MAENTPSTGSKVKSIICMALGIYSIVVGWAWGNGIVFAIVSLVLGGQCKKEGVQNTFTKVGKITGIIGLIGSIIGLIVCIILAIISAAANSYLASYGV